jgi:hypothetical protein
VDYERAGFTLGSLIPRLPYPVRAGSRRAGFSPITRAGFECAGFTSVGLIPRLPYPVFASPTMRAGSKHPGFTLGSLILSHLVSPQGTKIEDLMPGTYAPRPTYQTLPRYAED